MSSSCLGGFISVRMLISPEPAFGLGPFALRLNVNQLNRCCYIRLIILLQEPKRWAVHRDSRISVLHMCAPPQEWITDLSLTPCHDLTWIISLEYSLTLKCQAETPIHNSSHSFFIHRKNIPAVTFFFFCDEYKPKTALPFCDLPSSSSSMFVLIMPGWPPVAILAVRTPGPHIALLLHCIIRS